MNTSIVSTAPSDHSASHPIKNKHEAHIVHKIPGRIRLKVPAAKTNVAYFENYKKALSATQAIAKVEANAEIGSMTIHYDPKREEEFQSHFHHSFKQHHTMAGIPLPGDEIEELTKKFEAEAELLAEHSYLFRVFVDLLKNMDYQVRVVSNNNIDLKIILGGGLAVSTFTLIGAETATPMWLTLAFFAMNHYIGLRHEVLPAGSSQSV